MRRTHKYRDRQFFLPAIALVSAFNYYLTYTNIHLTWFLVFTYIMDTLEGWLAWWAVRSIIIYLDKVIPYGERPLKRIVIQLLLTTIAGQLIIILLTEMVSWLVKGRAAPLSFYLFDVFIFTIWFLVFNGIYIGMHYYLEWKQSEQDRSDERRIRVGGFSVRQGKQSLLIPFREIIGFYVENGYTLVLTWENKKFFCDKSLDKIEETLPREHFFRLNRQYLLHRDALRGFKRTGDGKIDVLVSAPHHFPEAIPVSRTKAISFKNWFQPDTV